MYSSVSTPTQVPAPPGPKVSALRLTGPAVGLVTANTSSSPSGVMAALISTCLANGPSALAALKSLVPVATMVSSLGSDSSTAASHRNSSKAQASVQPRVPPVL